MRVGSKRSPRGARGISLWIAGAILFIVGASAAAAGCGLDDTGITAIGVTTDASLIDVPVTSDAGEDADSGPVCNAKTCNSYPSDCHPALDDGCGKTIDCSTACPGGQACVPDAGAGVDAGFFCNGPPECHDAGAPGGNCGTLTNPGNGLTTACGTCANAGYTCDTNTCGCAGTTCGAQCCQTASGTPNCNASNNTCCKLKTCGSDYGGFCNAASDNGCGNTIDCSGNCGGGKVCDTTAAGGTCCTVTTTCGTACNTTLTTNCHTSLSCGACSTGTCDNTHNCCTNTVCGGTCCTAGQVCNGTVCCTRDAMGTTCGGKCGTVSDNCGVATSCGACTDGETCFGSVACPCASASCNPGQVCHISGSSGNGSCSG